MDKFAPVLLLVCACNLFGDGARDSSDDRSGDGSDDRAGFDFVQVDRSDDLDARTVTTSQGLVVAPDFFLPQSAPSVFPEILALQEKQVSQDDKDATLSEEQSANPPDYPKNKHGLIQIVDRSKRVIVIGLGKYIYLLRIDPGTPAALLSSRQYKFPVIDILVSGLHAYVALADGTIERVGIEGEILVPQGEIKLDGIAQAMATSGEILVVAGGYSGIELFSWTGAETDRRISRCDLEGYADDLAIVGKFAFVTGDNSGLATVSLTDPARCKSLGTSFGPRRFRSIEARGSTLFIGDDYALSALDLPDPNNPRLLERLALPNSVSITHLDDTGLFITATGPQLHLYRFDDRWQDLGTIATATQANDLDIVDATLLTITTDRLNAIPFSVTDRVIAQGTETTIFRPEIDPIGRTVRFLHSGGRIRSIVDPETAPQFGRFPVDCPVVDAVTTGVGLFAICPDRRLLHWRFNADTPELATTTLLEYTPRALAAAGDLVAVSDETGRLQLFSSRDPRAILLVGELELGETIRKISFGHDRLYCILENRSWVEIDLGDPGNPLMIATHPFETDLEQIVWFENKLLLADSSATLYFIDILSDSIRPTNLNGQLFIGRIRDIEVDGCLAALALGTRGIFTVDFCRGIAGVPPSPIPIDRDIETLSISTNNLIFLDSNGDGGIVGIDEHGQALLETIEPGQVRPPRLSLVGDMVVSLTDQGLLSLRSLEEEYFPVLTTRDLGFKADLLEASTDYLLTTDIGNGLCSHPTDESGGLGDSRCRKLESRSTALAIAGSKAFVAAVDRQLLIFELNNPDSPQQIATIELECSPSDIEISADNLFLLCDDRVLSGRIDRSGGIDLVDRNFLVNSPSDMAIYDDYLLTIADRSIDISTLDDDGSFIDTVSSLFPEPIERLFVVDDLLYLKNGERITQATVVDKEIVPAIVREIETQLESVAISSDYIVYRDRNDSYGLLRISNSDCIELLQNGIEVEYADITAILSQGLLDRDSFYFTMFNYDQIRSYYEDRFSQFLPLYPENTFTVEYTNILQSFQGDALDLSWLEVHLVPYMPLSVVVFDDRRLRFEQMLIGGPLDPIHGLKVTTAIHPDYRDSFPQYLKPDLAYIPDVNARILGFRYAMLIPELSVKVEPAEYYYYNTLRDWATHSRLERFDQVEQPIGLTNYMHLNGRSDYVVSFDPDFALSFIDELTETVVLTFFLWKDNPLSKEARPDFVFEMVFEPDTSSD